MEKPKIVRVTAIMVDDIEIVLDDFSSLESESRGGKGYRYVALVL